MWFGYCLTSDTRQQKFALLVGPPRSGKGTTMAVLGHILGQDNIASPSLTSMGSRFGLAPLIGKQAAIIGDGHLGRQSDAVAILERLKSIVGGDPQNIDRKGAPELANVQIKARFTISVNELPRLPDASAALRSRILLVPFNRTFEGKEDLGLQDRLRLEVPGITNWALNGLRQLQEAGKLIQPKAGQDILDDFVRLSSPVQAFVEDCCEVGGDYIVLTSDLRDGWKWWCAENGHEPGSTNTLINRLRTVARVERTRRRTGLSGSQARYYSGIRLNPETEERVKKGLYLVS
jgi:P4 family phage/plasmid primase-like protien